MPCEENESSASRVDPRGRSRRAVAPLSLCATLTGRTGSVRSREKVCATFGESEREGSEAASSRVRPKSQAGSSSSSRPSPAPSTMFARSSLVATRAAARRSPLQARSFHVDSASSSSSSSLPRPSASSPSRQPSSARGTTAADSCTLTNRRHQQHDSVRCVAASLLLVLPRWRRSRAHLALPARRPDQRHQARHLHDRLLRRRLQHSLPRASPLPLLVALSRSDLEADPCSAPPSLYRPRTSSFQPLHSHFAHPPARHRSKRAVDSRAAADLVLPLNPLLRPSTCSCASSTCAVLVNRAYQMYVHLSWLAPLLPTRSD